jgi:hypothetical protein
MLKADSGTPAVSFPDVAPALSCAALLLAAALVAVCREIEDTSRRRATTDSASDCRERRDAATIERVEETVYSLLRARFAGHRELTHRRAAAVVRRYLIDRGTDAFGSPSDEVAQADFARWGAGLGVTAKTAARYERLLKLVRSIGR